MWKLSGLFLSFGILLVCFSSIAAEDDNETAVKKMFRAIKASQVELLRESIALGAGVNTPEKGVPPLIAAVNSGNNEIVKTLLGNGASVNCTDRKGNTPVITACFNNRIEILKTLLEYSPDLLKVNETGYDALAAALKKKFTVTAEVLLDSGLPIEVNELAFQQALKCRTESFLYKMSERLQNNPEWCNAINDQIIKLQKTDAFIKTVGSDIPWFIKYSSFMIRGGIILFAFALICVLIRRLIVKLYGKKSKRKNKHQFSLIELLIVVSVIAILAGLLAPALVKARLNAQTAKCSANLSQIHKLISIYAIDYEGIFPPPAGVCNWGDTSGWMNLITTTPADKLLYKCPIESNSTLFSYSLNAREPYVKNGGAYASWHDSDFIKGTSSTANIIIVEETNLNFPAANCDRDNCTFNSISFTPGENYYGLNHKDKIPMAFVDGHVYAPHMFESSSMTYYTNEMSDWHESE